MISDGRTFHRPELSEFDSDEISDSDEDAIEKPPKSPQCIDMRKKRNASPSKANSLNKKRKPVKETWIDREEDIEIPPTPSYKRVGKDKKVVDVQIKPTKPIQKRNSLNTTTDEVEIGGDTDSGLLDVVVDRENRYEKRGEIIRYLQRLVIRGPGGSCYGVGMRPDCKQDLKKKKVGGAPKPGDVGFMKLGLATGGSSVHDGDEVQEIRYDWCSWNSGGYLI